jgi:cyclic pyranopterin phosphate synthase
MKRPLSHLSASGEAHMVDVAAKPETLRRALASARVRMRPETVRLVEEHGGPKGDVLGVARLAGILAAKRTAELIPLCHPIALTRVAVHFDLDVAAGTIEVKAAADAHGRTGVEMEAMVAASVAALTVYDMLKGVERGIAIDEVVLLEKSGGRSGHYRRDPTQGPGADHGVDGDRR